MSQLIQLTHPDGKHMWVDPTAVVSVQEYHGVYSAQKLGSDPYAPLTTVTLNDRDGNGWIIAGHFDDIAAQINYARTTLAPA
jgi:hypothetical protein